MTIICLTKTTTQLLFPKDLAVNDIVEIRDYDTTGNAIPYVQVN